MKKNTFFSPLEDFVFTQIFGEQRNIDNTKGFLKALLDIPEDEYDTLTVVSPILGKLTKRGKTGIVDVRLTTKSGKIIHIELQVQKRSNMKSRITYYSARQISDQLNWGDDYEKLHQVISIIICDHVLLEDEESYINDYEMRNKNNKSFTNLQKIVILELPKLPAVADGTVWPWLKFFKCEKKEEYEMLERRYPEMEKPIYCAKKMSLFAKWRDIRFHKNLWKVDERMLLKAAKEDGLAEGLALGHAEGHVVGHNKAVTEIARNLLAEGSSVEFVQKTTGLAPDVILKLQTSD